MKIPLRTRKELSAFCFLVMCVVDGAARVGKYSKGEICTKQLQRQKDLYRGQFPNLPTCKAIRLRGIAQPEINSQLQPDVITIT